MCLPIITLAIMVMCECSPYAALLEQVRSSFHPQHSVDMATAGWERDNERSRNEEGRGDVFGHEGKGREGNFYSCKQRGQKGGATAHLHPLWIQPCL